VCSLVFAASASAAAPVFAAPIDLSASGRDAITPQVAFDASGNALAAWTRSDGANFIVQTAFRPAGTAFGARIDLSAGGRDAAVPQVAFDASGNALAVWQRYDGTNTFVQSSFRPAGGAFAAPIDLSATGRDSTGPRVAFDASGNALAVWQRWNGANYIVQSSFRPAGGTFAAPIDLTVTGRDAVGPQVAFDASGNALAIWQRSNGTNTIIQSSFRPAGGAFAAPVDVSATGRDADEPRLAFDASGNALAVWRRFNGTTFIAQSSFRPAGGTFAAPVDLSATNSDVPQVVFDASGNALAVWRGFNATNTIIQSSFRPAGGTFAAPIDLSVAGRDAIAPQVAFDASGNALAVWQRFNGGKTIVQSSFRPAGGTFAAPVDLSIDGQNADMPQVAFDPSGNALAVWRRSNGTNTIVQAAFGTPARTLTVSTAGSSTGTVTTTGINCPGTCSHDYPQGTMVALTATPAAGSSFAGWSGGGCSGTGSCTVTMIADKGVTATFEPTRTLTVSTAGSGAVTGPGIDCPGTCSHGYPQGTVVALTATPAVGSSFAGWSGGCSGTGPCDVTLSSDQTVTATFALFPNHPPVCSDQIDVAVGHDTAKAIALGCTDADADPLTYSIVAQPVHGSLSTPDASGNLIFTPNGGYSGADSFTFKASDGHVDSGTATIGVTVAAADPGTSGEGPGPADPGTSGEVPSTITAAQVRALLLTEIKPSGKQARIGALLKSGAFTLIFTSLEPGTARIGWYWLPPGAHLATTKAKPVLVASGRLTFAAAGNGNLKLKLTRAGRRLLKHHHRLKLTAKGTFTPTGQPAISATKTFTLKR
jgi:hypothetical protein